MSANKNITPSNRGYIFYFFTNTYCKYQLFFISLNKQVIMIYQLTSCREILARVENNFDIDHSDWITRAPLWVADALDQMQMISAYEDKVLPLTVEDHIIKLPDDSPQDIRRILGVEYEGYLIRRLNTVNPIKQPKVDSEYNSLETYSIKNGYIITSIEDGDIKLYYQAMPLEYDSIEMIYYPKVPSDSVIQGAIEWYLIYCMLRRGHMHKTFSLESRNPITNPYMMWEQEKKKAKNHAGAFDPEERAEMSRMIRAFLIDTDRPITTDFRNEEVQTLTDGITGQTGI